MVHKFLFILLIGAFSCSTSKTIFELDPTQSMVITGKGPGQDATINPYIDQNSIAIVKNKGENALAVRIQQAGEILEIKEVPAGETKQFPLEKGHELYLDSDQATTAEVTFKKG